jgi:hypothetical protein
MPKKIKLSAKFTGPRQQLVEIYKDSYKKTLLARAEDQQKARLGLEDGGKVSVEYTKADLDRINTL